MSPPKGFDWDSYVYNPHEAHRRKEQARIAKAIVSKVKQEPLEDQELEEQSTSASLGPSTPALQNLPRPPQSPPPLPLQLRRWATTATLASTQADGRTTPTGRSTAATPSTASARPVARPYCRLRRAPPPPLRRVGTVTSCEPPATYPLNQLSSLAALSRDGAAVLNGPGLPQFFDASARTMEWFFDQTAQTAAAHMTVGVAAAPVLCWPVIAAAAPPALAPPLPCLLPVAVAPAMVGPHFAFPGPQM
ncbi:uncharacterized protein LOC142784607 [Rhipicephalus microplus]|uniref:uncharacterized protein LOC142784607 n=1 Tax=Rhipicephalus microplus TaxID=6941 RepID=UPI003F6A677B